MLSLICSLTRVPLPTSFSHALCRRFNCFVNLGIARTTAEVASQSIFHLLKRRLWVRLQQRRASQQHTGSAVTALRRAQFGEGFLQGVQHSIVLQTLDCGNLAVLYFQRLSHAR
jgi:hypothetical protein